MLQYMQQLSARQCAKFEEKMVVNKPDRLLNNHVHYHLKLVKSQGALMQRNRLYCLSFTTDLTLVCQGLSESPNKLRGAAELDLTSSGTPQGAANPS